MEDLRKYVCQPGSNFETVISSRLSVLNAKNLARETCPERVLFYEEETMYAIGQQRKLKRLYVRKPNEKYVGVGWVINEDIDFCMICAKQFGFFLYRHHCRSCGNLVCDPCSPHLLILEELAESGPQRVCIQCYWGQDPVHVARWRMNSEYGDDDMLSDKDDDRFAMLDDTDSDNADQFSKPSEKANVPVTPAATPSNQNNIAQRNNAASNANKSSLSPILDGAIIAAEIDNEYHHAALGNNQQNPSTPVADTEISIVPIPGICLKTRTKSGFKVFVNVCHHHLVPITIMKLTGPSPTAIDISQMYVVIGAIRDTNDKKGEDSCKLVDVAVNSDKYKEFFDHIAKKEKMFLHVLKVLEATLGEPLDEDYKTPKTPRNYKGGTDVFPVKFRVKPAAAAATSIATSIGESFNTPKKLSVAESILANERRGINSLRTNPIASASKKSETESSYPEQQETSTKTTAIAEYAKAEAEKAKVEKEELEAKEREAASAEKRRLELAQQQELEALEKLKLEKTRLEAEKAEQARLEAAAERTRTEQLRQEEAKKIELARETERLEKLKKEKEKLEAEAAAAAEQKKLEQIRREREELEQQVRKEKLEKELAQARVEAEAAELSRVKAEAEAKAKEIEDRKAKELEAARLAAEADERAKQLQEQQENKQKAAAAADADNKRASEQQMQQHARSSLGSVDSDDVRLSERGTRSSVTASGASAAAAGADSEDESDDGGGLGDDTIKVKPIPGIVLKTKTKKTALKYFINLCHHELIAATTIASSSASSSSSSSLDNLLVVVGDTREITDKSGESCLVVDCAINSKRFVQCMEEANTNLRDRLCIRVLKAVGKQLNESLDEDYKTPKTKNNYKQTDGANADVLVMDITAAVGTLTSSQRRSLVDMVLGSGRSSGSAAASTSAGVARSSSSGVGGIIEKVQRLSFGKQSAEAPAAASVTYVSAEEQAKWASSLARGERIIASGLVGKKNPVGLTQTRQLLLTDGPRLLYADPKSKAIKGEVDSPDGSVPVAVLVNASTIDVKTTQRVFRFIDTDKGAKYWVDKINSTFQAFS